MTTPTDYGVPHDAWRPHQENTVKKLLLPEQINTQILVAPTGSGKSTFAAALGHKSRVVALMESKVLQKDQYQDYGFTPLMGRGNYPCVSYEHPSVKMCDMCPYIPRMQDCSVSEECTYLEQKSLVANSRRATYNYALFLALHDSMPENAWYVEDEAHILPDLVIQHSGIIVTEQDVKKFSLPPIPAVADADGALGYLSVVAVAYKSIFDALKNKTNRTRSEREMFRAVERNLKNVDVTIGAMRNHADDWYYEDNGEALIIMPLTARFHAPRIFRWSSRKNLLMSATIGNADVLARELGISLFDKTVLPHQYHKRHRPIYDMRCPKIGYTTKPKAYREWADSITSFIHLAPPNWGGLILVNSKAQAFMLKDLLSDNVKLKQRLFVANPKVGTDAQMRQWNQFKKKQIGAICISWSFWQGVSFNDEKILIVAKTPFPMLSSYEKARRDYNKSYFYQRVAQKLAQGLGRTRRSSADYDTNGRQNSLVGIADGNWYIVKRFMPKYIREAVTRL